MNDSNPEIGKTVRTGDIVTNYQDVGSGKPVLLLHGSGPGVSAWANWRGVLAGLSDEFHLLAPDLAGFGYTEVPPGIEYSRACWLAQIVDFLDALELEKVHLVGNSFGGSMALALAIRYPERVDRIVLMGSVGVPFELTAGLDAVWGYEPSFDNMQALMRDTFAYDPSLINDQLVASRHQASLRTQQAFASMFPPPRQRWVDAMAHEERDIRSIRHPTLMVHGRDDKVIPVANSLLLHQWIDDSQVHLFGRCGHWTQIEKGAEFCCLLRDFFGR